MRQILAKNEKDLEDASFFIDFLESICKDYKIHFCQFNKEMTIEVLFDKTNSGSF